MAKKPDTADQLAKAAEARARREALQSAAFGAEPEKPATVPAEPMRQQADAGEAIAPPAPPAAPKAPVEPVDGDGDKAALMEAGEDDDAPARPQRSRSPKAKPASKSAQPSRVGTVPVTFHGPPIVRQQLKMLSAEKDRKMGDLVAEALNMLFRKYDKPAIAPRDK